MDPQVSIIIPVYNAEKYIGECLASVSGQTFRDLEVLCIDDCSTDRSAEIVRHQADCDSRIALVKNEKNLGAGETRNRGITLAKGKYFFFLDADDFLDRHAIEILYQNAERNQLQLCFCSHVVYNEADGSCRKSPQTTDVFLKKYAGQVFSWEDIRRFLYQNIFCVPWNRLYRTDFVRNSSIRFPDLKNSEDFFFGEAVVAAAERMGVAGSDSPLVYYRIGREGQVSSTVGWNPYCMLESVKLLYGFLKKNHKLEGAKRSYHTIALEVLLFPILSAAEPGPLIKYTIENGFSETGMERLGCGDFTNIACYKRYCDFLSGRLSYFDIYMTAVKEDKEKCNQVKDFLKKHQAETTALWGMAKKGQALLSETGCIKEFDYFIDSNPEKASREVKEISVHKYEEIEEALDYVIITNAAYFEEIYTQCKKKNPSCKIIDLDTFFRCDMTIEECMA